MNIKHYLAVCVIFSLLAQIAIHVLVTTAHNHDAWGATGSARWCWSKRQAELKEYYIVHTFSTEEKCWDYVNKIRQDEIL